MLEALQEAASELQPVLERLPTGDQHKVGSPRKPRCAVLRKNLLAGHCRPSADSPSDAVHQTQFPGPQFEQSCSSASALLLAPRELGEAWLTLGARSRSS